MKYCVYLHTVHSTRKPDEIAHNFNCRNVVMPKTAVASKTQTIFSWAVDSHFLVCTHFGVWHSFAWRE